MFQAKFAGEALERRRENKKRSFRCERGNNERAGATHVHLVTTVTRARPQLSRVTTAQLVATRETERALARVARRCASHSSLVAPSSHVESRTEETAMAARTRFAKSKKQKRENILNYCLLMNYYTVMFFIGL